MSLLLSCFHVSLIMFSCRLFFTAFLTNLLFLIFVNHQLQLDIRHLLNISSSLVSYWLSFFTVSSFDKLILSFGPHSLSLLLVFVQLLVFY